MLAGYPNPNDKDFWNKELWNGKLAGWRRDGYNALIWYGPNELTSGEHLLIRHVQFPEARELPPEENERRIAQMAWLFRRGRELGFQNHLMTHLVFFTKAFG